MAEKPVKIQVIPPFGDCYQIILPAAIQTDQQIRFWIYDNLQHIESWAWKRLED